MKKMTYESALQELQTIVDALQENTLGVDELSSQLQRAAELVKFCREKLRTTEAEIKDLFADEGTEDRK